MDGQIEVYSNGSTHTLYEFCGASACREAILVKGFGFPVEPAHEEDVLWTEDGKTKVSVTLLDESSTCIWCFGCGDFLQHGTDDGGCECAERGYNPEEDREPMRPMVHETGALELRPFV